MIGVGFPSRICGFAIDIVGHFNFVVCRLKVDRARSARRRGRAFCFALCRDRASGFGALGEPPFVRAHRDADASGR
jgi:hypothetical protein